MKGSVKLMGKKRFTPEYKEEIIKLVTAEETGDDSLFYNPLLPFAR